MPRPRLDAEPLQRWVYRCLREAILAGQLRPGAPVPSSRRMAATLEIARGTVVLAYEQLVSEGYLTSRRGAGMYVSPQVPDRLIAPPAADAARAQGQTVRLAPAASPFTLQRGVAAFAPHRCDTSLLPLDELRRLHSRMLRRSHAFIFDDGPAAGLPALRRAIATHLGEARGLAVAPDQVLVLGSVQQALDVALRVLTRPGEAVWLEDPGYAGARRLLEISGRLPVFVPVDAEGLQVEHAQALAPAARLACVTPSRQAPLGVPMSPGRRAQLLAWAHAVQAWVVEDDYDSEYRFNSRPVPPLASDDAQRVLLAGSFSKLLYPGLRIAYLACPPGLVDAFAATLSLSSRHPNLLTQAVLAAFIEEGHLARHVRRMRRVYEARAQAFVDAARRHWHGLIELPQLHAGLDVTARLLATRDDRQAARRLRAAGVQCEPLSDYCAQARLPAALVMGFAAVPDDELARAAGKVAEALAHRA